MDFEEIALTVGWKSFAKQILSLTVVEAALKDQLHTLWTVSGHKIREQVADDILLADFLWKALPSFSGEALVLFRGENRTRWKNDQLGFCWTSNIQTARMFGRGLNAIHSGGVLLRAEAGGSAIIAGPSPHSEYLSEIEYTLDPRRLDYVQVTETFPIPT